MDIYSMDVLQFIKFRIAELEEEKAELINDLQKVCHSPHELAFLSGRIAEIQDQLYKLEYYRTEYIKTEDDDF